MNSTIRFGVWAHWAVQTISVRQSFLEKYWLGVIVVAVAALVRFWHLDFHSFWFDEAVSLRWATSEIGFIWEKTFPLIEEKHPPAYYTALHLWLRLLELPGLHQSDAAIRASGALLGIVSAWASWRLATRLSNTGVGLLTGMLVALSPVLVWYSQEARMFQPATTGILLGALGLHMAWHTPTFPKRVGWWIIMVGGLSFALYAYLFSAFVMPAAGLSLIFLYAAQPRRGRFLEGVGALAVVTLLFLPLAQNAWGVNAAESTPGRAFDNFWANHVRLLQVFTIWRVSWPMLITNLVLLLWAGLLLLGLIPIGMQRNEDENWIQGTLDKWWLWLWLGLPLLIANVLLSRSGSIFDEDRYLIFLAPFALWGAARGAAAIYRRLPLAGITVACILLISLVAALPQVWSADNYRENWRAAAQYIVDYTGATPGMNAAVVAHIDYTNLPLQWYLRQAFTHEQMPVFFPFGGWIDPARIEEDVAPPLRGIEELGVDTLWLVQAHLQHVDAEGLVEDWLQKTYPVVTELYPAGIKLTGHSLRREHTQLPAGVADDAFESREVAPGLFLDACSALFPQVAARDMFYHPPSGWVHVQSWWRAEAPQLGNIELTGRLVAPGAIWGASLARPADIFRLHPPANWTPGAHVRSEMDINLNPLTPPGNYSIELSLEIDGREHVAPCGTVDIR